MARPGSDISRCPVVHFEQSPAPTPGQSFFTQLDGVRRAHEAFRSDEAQGYWVLTRQKAIVEALQHPEIFSSTALVPTIPEPTFRWMPEMLDPPEHTKWRRLLGGWFSPGRTAKLEEPARQLVRELVEGLVDTGSCDFVADFSARFPTSIFLNIIGLPQSELPTFAQWMGRILLHTGDDADGDGAGDSTGDISDSMVAMDEVKLMFKGLIAERRADPAKRSDDIISASLDWQIDGAPVDESDLLDCLLLLFLAGLDTVTAQLSFSFQHLATHDDDRRSLIEAPTRIPGAVEEMLRAFAIVRLGRKVTSDVDFHGCPMKAGDMVYLPLAFATRDEDVFDNGTEIDFDRSGFANLAFGAGPHRCLGSHLARRELVVAVEEWHRRIPDYQIRPGHAVVEHSGLGVYGVDSLPLVW